MTKENQGKILIVDDEDRNRRLLAKLVGCEGYDHLEVANGAEALERVRTYKPDIVLLDVMMPEMDGYQVAAKMKYDPDTREIPIIMVTALDDRKSRVRGLAAGAEEFVSKPIDAGELQIRIRNLLRLKQANDIIKDHNRNLETKVQERTVQLKTAFSETILALMHAAEYRDDETGAHVQRICEYSKMLSKKIGMANQFSETIHYASAMHDIGKIGIPDCVLLKPGKFAPDEWEIMKTHTTIGAKMLSGAFSSPYLKMGKEIAMSHHERFDGTGYPMGLSGEDIPISARIVQVCDVYDALRSERPYKLPFSHEKTVAIIFNGEGQTQPEHFDPNVLAAFQSNIESFRDVYESHTE